MKKFVSKIKEWYRGKETELIAVKRDKYVDVYARYEKSTSAKIVSRIVYYCRTFFRWITHNTTLALTGIVLTIFFGVLPFIKTETKTNNNPSKQKPITEPNKLPSVKVENIIHNQPSSSNLDTRSHK